MRNSDPGEAIKAILGIPLLLTILAILIDAEKPEISYPAEHYVYFYFAMVITILVLAALWAFFDWLGRKIRRL